MYALIYTLRSVLVIAIPFFQQYAASNTYLRKHALLVAQVVSLLHEISKFLHMPGLVLLGLIGSSKIRPSFGVYHKESVKCYM